MFIEALESRVHFSVVTLTANTTGVLTLKSGEILNGNGHKVGGVTGVDVSSVTVENLDVVGTRGTGISIDADKAGISGLTLSNVIVSGFGSGYGVLIGTVGKGTYSNISLNDITAFSNGDAGIATYGNTGSISLFSLTNSAAYNNLGITGSNSPSGSGIMVGGLNNATVEYCVAYNNGGKNNSSSGPVGIFAYDSNAVTISNCNSYNNKTEYHDGGGFDLDGGVTNSTIINCTSSGNVGYGFAAFTFAGSTANSGNYFLNNISTGDGEGFEYWSNGPSITNLTATGNQFLNPTSGYAVIGGTGSAYVNIVLSSNTYSSGALTWIGT